MSLKDGREQCIANIHQDLKNIGVMVDTHTEDGMDKTHTALMVEFIVDRVISLFIDHAEVEVELNTNRHVAIASTYPVKLTYGVTKGKGIK